jgi:hypothetical protein
MIGGACSADKINVETEKNEKRQRDRAMEIFLVVGNLSPTTSFLQPPCHPHFKTAGARSMTMKGRLLFTSASVDFGAKNITKLSSLEVLDVEEVEKDIFIID